DCTPQFLRPRGDRVGTAREHDIEIAPDRRVVASVAEGDNISVSVDGRNLTPVTDALTSCVGCIDPTACQRSDAFVGHCAPPLSAFPSQCRSRDQQQSAMRLCAASKCGPTAFAIGPPLRCVAVRCSALRRGASRYNALLRAAWRCLAVPWHGRSLWK